MNAGIFRFTAAEKDEGLRLDAFLAGELTRVSEGIEGRAARFTRARVQKLIDAGRVRLDGAAAKASARLKIGAVAEVEIPAPKAIAPQPEAIPLHVLHEDADLIVVDKPAGLAAHAGAGRDSGTLVNALLAHCTSLSRIGDALRPGIVHRLDKDTSGVLVAAKSDLAHQSLAAQFHAHTIERAYVALVWGAPPDRLTVGERIARDPKNRKRFAAFPAESETGRRAVTHVRVEERYGAASLVACTLETGRTHQIRVHLSSRGYPVIGDALYGGARVPPAMPAGRARELAAGAGRQMLHAATLGFVHPRTGGRVSYSTAPPPDMQRLIDAFRSLR